MRYSASERRWYGKRPSNHVNGINPYLPEAPRYAERNIVTRTKLSNGATLVSTGSKPE